MAKSEHARYPLEQIKELLTETRGINPEITPPKKERELVEDILNFDTYAVDIPSKNPPPNPCVTTHEHHNPAIEDHCQHHDWDESGWSHDTGTTALTAYPEYTPTDTAIDTIMRYDPIIEIGAGNGYWAYVLELAGCDIHPTDIRPEKGTAKITFTNNENADDLTRTELTGNTRNVDGDTRYEIRREKWTDVHSATHNTVSTDDRTVMLCHPPGDHWTEELLNHISQNQHLIYIGQWYPGSDATPYFFHELTDWTLEETFPVYSWDTQHAHGYVFTPPTP